MAMSREEFLRHCKENPPENEILRRMREREAEEDAMYAELSKLIEEHPIHIPRGGRVCGPID
jgi:hypothetical protein